MGFYGVCGYRICGQRVVRIDMLERLADLVRDRVFWKARFPDEARPAGSIEGGGFTVVADMMSLVGCSGEVFEGILKSLGFRSQKKKIKRPLVAQPLPAAPAEILPVPAEVLETPAEIPPLTIEIPPAAEAATSTTLETQLAPPAEALMEEVEIEVWWPKDTGPFRHKPEARKPQPERPKRPERKPREQERKKPREEPPRRPEKPVDPNSPFAALLALKAKMRGN